MLPSMQNKRFELCFTVLNVIILFSKIKTAIGTDLVDLPLKLPTDNANIYATLTDADGEKKYTIQEYISASDSNTKGKIVISGEKDYNIYYNTAPNVNRERLVIHGTNCLPFTFKNNWDKTLPGIDKPVTNLVLLLGPSILYRLGYSPLVWTTVEDKNIRGIMMKGAKMQINTRLTITFYYKKLFDDDSGIKNPSRIEFNGHDPYLNSYFSKENLILDIYIQNEDVSEDLANEVQPLPGIGCPHYLNLEARSLPIFTAEYLHYTMSEHIQGSTNTRTLSEIYALRMDRLLRIKANVLGVATEAIYDHQLGVSYLFLKDGECSMSSADLNSPGVGSAGFFSFIYLFMIDEFAFPFLYIGRLNLEHQSGFPVEVWEAVNYNVSINGKKVDKAVITQYMVKSENNAIFLGHTPVSTTITTYKLDSSKKTYIQADRITRDYMNFQKAGSEDELQDIFTLKSCKYLASDNKLTLGFRFKCEEDVLHCTEDIRENTYLLRQSFKNNVLRSYEISQLRIDSIEYNFNDGQIEIVVTFLDAPKFEYIARPKSVSVSPNTFAKMKTIGTSESYECLEKLSNYQDQIAVAIYRPSDSICGYLRHFDDLEEDVKTGQQCKVYHFPLFNLNRLFSEVPLDKIHDVFLRKVGQSFYLLDGDIYRMIYKPYKLVDVIDKTKGQATSTLQTQARYKAQLKINDQVTVAVPDAKSFSDCYRTCHDSEILACNTFSLCVDGESLICRVSSLTTDEILIDSNIEQDNNCTIYSSNALNDYSEVRQRKYKVQTSVAVKKSLDHCAEYCHASPDCFSFQYCDYSCSFGGLYTDATTEYDEECSVFYPKTSEKFQKTGNKIVPEVFHSEINLNLDQCAALCDGWSDGDIKCKSFNYCPKNKKGNSCLLTEYSVRSPVTETSDGDGCFNYELKVESSGKKNKESSSTEVPKGTSSSGAFGIIMLFLFIGGLLGFAAPIAYAKVKHLRNASGGNQSYAWSLHVDENIN